MPQGMSGGRTFHRADPAQDREHVEASAMCRRIIQGLIEHANSGAVTAVPTDGIDAASLNETASSVCIAVL
jgi:hypothetical protein